MPSRPDALRARARRGLFRTARGPVRSRLRSAQARSAVLARGRRPGPPDFVGIGVQRAGTSWWHGILESHPRIDELGWTAKELHFFDARWDRELTGEDIRAYEAHFLRGPGQLAGEWTPRYLSDPWAVPLLHRAAPNARLLVMLRDPVERLRSALGHAQDRLGGVTPDILADAVARGDYAAQLARVLDTVPRDQVLVLQFERCRTDTQAMAELTFDFLGVDPIRVPEAMRTGSNASSQRFELPGWLLDTLVGNYADGVSRLQAMLPGVVDLGLWPHFAHLA